MSSASSGSPSMVIDSPVAGRRKMGKPLKFSPPGLVALGSPINFTPHQPLSSSSSAMFQSSNRMRFGPVGIRMTTVELLEVFTACNPSFQFDKALNPRRVLTKPSKPCFNNGYDNEKHDYILYVNDVIGNEEGRKYVILDLLGQGTFGQVVKCQRVRTGELVAVKVIKNQTAYFNQSMMEVTVLELLNGKHDPDDRHHIVRMKDTFIFRQHLCVVVELLSLNLYELIRQNQYRGFSLQICRIFLAQILDAMKVLKESKIIHCDLKPENILLKNLDSPGIKVIDYGSACHEQQTLYTYIQSRFYRSPEVLLGLPYSSSIDMWSLGCIAAELFLGLPIFPGASNYDQVARIVETLGIPPNHMIELGRDAALYFDKRYNGPGFRYTLKSRERYSLETSKNEAPSKKYFATSNLEELVMGYPVRPKDMSAGDKENEMRQRRLFLDFLQGLLKYNPIERWHPQQALQHPFITGKVPTTTSTTAVPPPSSSNKIQTPAVKIQAPPQNRARPRANTLSSLSLQDIPPQIQKVATASKATGGQAKPAAARQPPAPEAVRAAVEGEAPPSLPFEVGSVGSAAQLAQIQDIGMPSSSISNGSQSSSSKQARKPHYVDRLAGYATNRRVSNPPSMGLAIRGNGRQRFGSRIDSIIGGDDFPGPSSMPATTGSLPSPVSGIGMDFTTGATTATASRRLSLRRSSEPFTDPQQANAMANKPRLPRRGSLASASGLSGPQVPSSLNRSLTISDIALPNMVGQSSTTTTTTTLTASTTTSGSLGSASSSQFMDTLEEADEPDESEPDRIQMDEEEDTAMDIVES